VPGAEVALVVEDAVVGQRLFVRDALDAPLAQQRGGVVDLALAVRKADQRGDAVGALGQLGDRLVAGLQEAGPDQQVFRRLAADRKLRERHQIRTAGVCLGHQLADRRGIGGDGADGEVELGKGKAELGAHG
jgi:hypothetical protein